MMKNITVRCLSYIYAVAKGKHSICDFIHDYSSTLFQQKTDITYYNFLSDSGCLLEGIVKHTGKITESTFMLSEQICILSICQ